MNQGYTFKRFEGIGNQSYTLKLLNNKRKREIERESHGHCVIKKYLGIYVVWLDVVRRESLQEFII